MTSADVDVRLPPQVRSLDGFSAVGREQWKACCPAHHDGTPSLRVSVADDKVLMHCFTGCSITEITAAIAITEADLFLGGSDRLADPARVRARYVYEDADGRPLYRLCRHDRSWRPKFFLEHLDDHGDWVSGRGEHPPMLYRLPQVLALPPGDLVFCTEGERDADSLWALGLAATTVPSNSWARADLTALLGLDAYIICDADQAGISHGRSRVKELRRAGVTVEDHNIFFPKVPGCAAPDITDAVEWVQQHPDGCLGADALLARVMETLTPIDEWGGPKTLDDRMVGRYTHVPYEVLTCGRLAESVYLRLGLLAAGSGEAHTTASALAEHLEAGPNQVSAALKALESARMISKIRRGRYRLLHRGN